MKLRSIALAGLLGAGLLMTSGCNEDDVLDELGDLLKENVVYTVNGTASDVSFTVGSNTTFVVKKEFSQNVLTGSDSYAVTYTPNNGITPVSFNDGSIYMYTATTCNSEGHLNHEANTNKINIVNLGSAITPSADTSIVITQADGTTTHPVSETVNTCAITGTASLNSVVFENGMTVTVTEGGVVTKSHTVSGVDQDIIDLASNVKVDLVIFDDNTISAVPMIGYADLVKIGSN